MADTIRVDYLALQHCAAKCAAVREDIAAVLRHLQQQHDALRPAWEGPAADVFFVEAVVWLAAL